MNEYAIERGVDLTSEPTSLVQRFARRLAFSSLRRLQRGRIVLHERGGQTTEFGPATQAAVTLTIHSPRVYSRLLFEGSLGAGRAWIDADWSCSDLPGLLRLFLSEPGLVGPKGRLDSPAARLASLGRRLLAPLVRNTTAGSRRNIAAHYDLGNDFYARMLDSTLTYSAGIFGSPTDPLETAQFEKYDRICRELDLQPAHRVLEIGTGWGGFAIHAASHYGCHVTTTTISRAQFEASRARVAELGLQDRVQILFADYRKLEGRFDRLVSIEMIEAVGAEYLDIFFRVCSDRLLPDGVMGLQSIVIADQAYERSRRHVDFIKQYVFPGGFLPSIAAISDRVARVTDFRLQSLYDLTPDYAETIRRWRANLEADPDAYETVTGRAEFKRLWEYYLAYCEAGFEERHVGCVQITLTKSGWRPECSTK